jgi:hypothetical protein
MRWHTFRGLVGIDQSPDNAFEVTWQEALGHLVDAFVHEQETSPFVIPDDRLSFRNAST